ncbi:MAG: pentapeptide repeat-containing protein [Bacteroidota bacterium]
MKLLFILIATALSTNCASTHLDKSRDSLENQLRTGVDVFIENKTFREVIDFTGILLSNPVSEGMQQARFTSSITFKNCVFENDVLAYSKNDNGQKTFSFFQSNLSFIGCSFKDTVNFRASSIMGRTVFTSSFFEKAAIFEECTFFQNTHFNQCVFHGELRFQNTFFMQRANFMDAAFDGNASFQGSTFHSTAQFSNTKFYGYSDFSLINWNETCFFNYAQIHGRSVFNSAHFSQIADFNSVSFENTEIKNCFFMGKTSFAKSDIIKRLSLDHSYFLLGVPDLGFFDKEKLSTVDLVFH